MEADKEPKSSIDGLESPVDDKVPVAYESQVDDKVLVADTFESQVDDKVPVADTFESLAECREPVVDTERERQTVEALDNTAEVVDNKWVEA